MAKGQNFQWKICKKLSKWWSDSQRDDIFCPTSQSGGRSTTRTKTGITTENSAGDVGYLDAIGKPLIDIVCIEVKRGYSKRIKYLNIIDGKGAETSIILKWWKKLLGEMISVNRLYPLMIFKRDYKDICISTNKRFLSELEKYNGNFSGDYILLSVKNKKAQLYTFNFYEFIRWCNRETVELIWRDKCKCTLEQSQNSIESGKQLRQLKKIRRRRIKRQQ